MALFWLSALACGRRLNDEHTKQNSTNRNLPSKSIDTQDDLNSRSYGLQEPEIDYPDEFKSDVSEVWMPKSSSKSMVNQIHEPEIDDYGEPEKPEQLNEAEEMDSFERLEEPEKTEDPKDGNEDFEQVKKVKEVSIFSLKPKERNKAIDPISDQQGRPPMRIIRPMRDLSIVVRNRHNPILIARQVPVHWIPRNHHRPYKPPHPHKPLLPHKPLHPHKPSHPHKPLYPHKPHHPSMPKHKPCKPCDPKVHKKHKPKKPKKKPKKEHCHHNSKKPHHKRLLYYAPIPTAMNYYGSPIPVKLIKPSNNYAVVESLENEDVEIETEKPFHQEVEDDVEEHRLAEMIEPFDEEVLDGSKMKSIEKL